MPEVNRNPKARSLFRAAAMIAFCAVGCVSAGGQGVISLTWLQDSSTYMGSWTGAHLLSDTPPPDGDGVWGWCTQNGRILGQYTDFQVTGADAATIFSFRLDSRSVPFCEASEFNHFQLQVSTTDASNDSFHSVGEFVGRKTTADQLTSTTPMFQDFTLQTPVQARYVRLFVEDNYGGNYIMARQFQVFGEVPAPEASTWAMFALFGTAMVAVGIVQRRKARRRKPPVPIV